VDGIAARLDAAGCGPLLVLADTKRWRDDDDVQERAAAAVDAFKRQYGLKAPVATRRTSWKPRGCVVAENVAIDGSLVDFEGRKWFDASRVCAVDGIVDDALRADLLEAIRATPEQVDKRAWRRGGLRDVVGDGAAASGGACWGLSPRALAKLCDPKRPRPAILELQSRLVAYLRRCNDDGLVVSLLPEAALGADVSPLAANAPVWADGDAYGWHIDGDPLLLPPGPFSDFYGRNPNRARGKPRFVSALVYLSPDWPSDFGAPTEFLDPPTGETVRVAPAPGRVVFLDQDVSHRVVAPTAAAGTRPRYSLVLKLVLHPSSDDATARFAPDDASTVVGSARRRRGAASNKR